MNRLLISATATLCVAALSPLAPAYALSVESTPGSLRQIVTAATEPATETSLTVTGAINAVDFDFLREMTALRSLDLSNVTITEYSGSLTETGLTSAKGNTLPDCALMSGNFTTLILPSGLTEISDGALGGANVENLVIPPSVKKIAVGAFADMKNLKSVTIPSSVTSLGDMAFSGCQSLETAAINAAIAVLPEATFRNCKHLSEVTLPTSLTKIGSCAFAGCSELKTLSLPTSLTAIGDLAFAASGITSLNLSDAAVSEIGDWAFAGCQSLKNITIGKRLQTIGKGAFFNNPVLSVKLGELAANLTEIPDYLLYGDGSVSTEGFAGTAVETIGNYALSGIKSSSVSLPNNLTRLGDNAMERWANLTEINAATIADIPALGESVWAETPQAATVLRVPQELYQGFKDAPQWQDFNVQTDISSNIDILLEENTSNLRAYFDGMLLMLEAGCEIRAAQLYDVSGRCFTIADNGTNNRMIIDTAPFDAHVFIVRLLLADGTMPTLKLLR